MLTVADAKAGKLFPEKKVYLFMFIMVKKNARLAVFAGIIF